MEQITDRDLEDALRVASEAAGREVRASMVGVAAALRARNGGPANPLREIATALEYYPVEPVAPADPGVLPLWVRALAQAPRPLVAARFADLLWTARYGDTPNEWAQRSIDAYLAAVYDEFGHVLEVAEGLQCALRIATEIDDHPRRSAAIAALIGLADRSIASEERSSGVALSIIESLADLPPDTRPAELDVLLEAALHRYRDDAWLLECALDIKARLVEPAGRRQLHVEQVDAFARLARCSAGLLRHAHYEHAIDIASRNRLPELAEQLHAEINAPLEPDPSNQRDATNGANGPIDSVVVRIVGDDSLGEALARFGASLPTEGHKPTLDDSDRQRVAYFGVLAADVLARIRHRYGSASAAGAWFECPLIDATVASGIAHGIELHEAGDFGAAASVLVLQVVRIMQSVAGAAGVIETGVIEAGGGRGIGELLEALTGALYEPSRRYLCAFVLDATDRATAPDAALLVHAACHLRLLQPVEVIRPS